MPRYIYAAPYPSAAAVPPRAGRRCGSRASPQGPAPPGAPGAAGPVLAQGSLGSPGLERGCWPVPQASCGHGMPLSETWGPPRASSLCQSPSPTPPMYPPPTTSWWLRGRRATFLRPQGPPSALGAAGSLGAEKAAWRRRGRNQPPTLSSRGEGTV